MTARTKPCKNGPRHAWSWVKNLTTAQAGGRVTRFRLHGLYRCACGQQKVGAPNHDGPDLRALIGIPSSTTSTQP